LKRKSIAVLLVVAGMAIVAGYFLGAFGPRNFQECVLRYVPDTTTPQASVFARDACREMFPRFKVVD